MPELPDVQIFKEYFDATSLHQTIERVEVSRDEILESDSERSLQRRLKGRPFESTRRHGKHLFAEIREQGWLAIHFGMTGHLDYARDGDPPEYTRALFRFDNGAWLAYVCPRLLGKLEWTQSVEKFLKDNEIGVDAASPDLDFPRFLDLIGSKRGGIKSALMDQSTIAGLGNVYVDEILFQAQVHPKTKVARLDEGKLKQIYQEMEEVLQTAIEARTDPEQLPENFLLPRRGQDEAACPRCKTSLKTEKVSGRTSYFCPECQS